MALRGTACAGPPPAQQRIPAQRRKPPDSGASPTSACFSASASLMPSPRKPTARVWASKERGRGGGGAAGCPSDFPCTRRRRASPGTYQAFSQPASRPGMAPSPAAASRACLPTCVAHPFQRCHHAGLLPWCQLAQHCGASGGGAEFSSPQLVQFGAWAARDQGLAQGSRRMVQGSAGCGIVASTAQPCSRTAAGQPGPRLPPPVMVCWAGMPSSEQTLQATATASPVNTFNSTAAARQGDRAAHAFGHPNVKAVAQQRQACVAACTHMWAGHNKQSMPPISQHFQAPT